MVANYHCPCCMGFHAEGEGEITRLREELENWKACNLYPATYREALERIVDLERQLAEARAGKP